MRDRRGQSTVEYMMLLCMGTMIVVVVGSFLKKYLPEITDRLIDLILRTAIELASP